MTRQASKRRAKERHAVATLQKIYKRGTIVEVVDSNYSGINPGDRGTLEEKVDSSVQANSYAIKFTKNMEIFHNACWKRQPTTRIICFRIDQIKKCQNQTPIQHLDTPSLTH